MHRHPRHRHRGRHGQRRQAGAERRARSHRAGRSRRRILGRGIGPQRNGHTWQEWGGRADHYLKHLEGLVWPKLFVLGGGITKNPEKWLQYLHPRTPIVLAQLINNAGIVGAADAAA